MKAPASEASSDTVPPGTGMLVAGASLHWRGALGFLLASLAAAGAMTWAETRGLVDSLRRAGDTPVVVLLTDGRANIARDGSPGRQRATEDALTNLADLPNVGAVSAGVERYLYDLVKKQQTLAGATVVLDPPRAGAGAKVVQSLVNLKPAHIIYVACDPVSFARDLKQLTVGGYRLNTLRAFDLFPHTHHVETVASLVYVN